MGLFCLKQAQLAITDGCWSGTAMLLQVQRRSWLPVLVLLQELLLVLLLASVRRQLLALQLSSEPPSQAQPSWQPA